jgi:hypothetical protein
MASSFVMAALTIFILDTCARESEIVLAKAPKAAGVGIFTVTSALFEFSVSISNYTLHVGLAMLPESSLISSSLSSFQLEPSIYLIE